MTLTGSQRIPGTAARPKRVGVLFVHGVGTAAESDTLIDFAGSLIGWLQRWYAGHPNLGTSPSGKDFGGPRVTEGRLSFDPVDSGDPESEISHATVELPNGDVWVCAESWWAYSARPLPFIAMLTWSFRHLWGLLWNLAESRVVRLRGLENQPGPLLALEALYCVGLIAGYLAAGLVGYLLLVPIFIAAQIPYPPIQNFILLTLLRPILQYNASELRTYVEDDIQAANMRRKVAESVRWLTRSAADGGGGCEAVTIIVHSGGCWVVFDMLTEPTYAREAAHVRRLITFGNGLNKAWEIAPDLLRLQRPVRGAVFWLDQWASYDPVPVQWMDPPRNAKDTRPGIYKLRIGRDLRKWVPVYEPDDCIKKWLIPRDDPRPPAHGGRRQAPADPLNPDDRYWPESRQVVNRMSPLSDHGGYFTNDEEVLRRWAAEVDTSTDPEPRYHLSQFWTTAPPPEAARTARRERVAVLSAVRAVAVMIGVVCIVAWAGCLGGFLGDIGPLKSLGESIDSGVKFVESWPVVGSTAATAAVWLKYAIGLAAGAVVASLPALLGFEIIRRLFWEPFDFWARKREVTERSRSSPLVK